MGFSRQEYWNGLPFPSPGNLPNPGIEPRSPVLQADSLPTELGGKLRGVTFSQFTNVMNQDVPTTECLLVQSTRVCFLFLSIPANFSYL